MEYLKTYQLYNDDLILEKLDLKNLLYQLKNSINKRHIAKLIVGSFFTLMTLGQTIEYIKNNKNIDNDTKSLLIDVANDEYTYDLNLKKPTEFKLSKDGWDHIKNKETLKLKAYSIGDGMITIGYGHAEKIGKSKYKVGDTISIETANKLLIEDVNIAAKGIKRMFKQWEDEGIEIKINQNQYDVLVSMAFNMGVSGLRRSQFIQTLKHDNIQNASELILKTGISNKFPGLKIRRLEEYDKFINPSIL